ncbi:MAG TPA: MFS transporter [Chloroflexia bacterium]|jgi:FSR family fosmidomycin resistance protein-like MFS transporter
MTTGDIPTEKVDVPQEAPPPRRRFRLTRRLSLFALVLLAIEFLDELAFGVREAAWPLIRDDLGLDYVQVGILLGVPNFIAGFIEPAIGILGDVWRRKVIVLTGGVFFGLSLLATALSGDFWLLLASFIVFSPASGAFVSLSQATLMDSEPTRHEQNMARWGFAGSLGVVAGTLAISAVAASSSGVGWRGLFVFMAGLTGALLLIAWRFRFPRGHPEDEDSPGFVRGLLNAVGALRRGEVVRWLSLLTFSDLMLDILLGFLTLYMVDVVSTSPELAALAATVWMGVGLLGDFLLIPLLERVSGLVYLRVSALAELILFPAFLLAPDVWMKFVLLALLGLFNAGWYSILQGRLYSSMPGQSGSVMAVSNVFGLVGSLVPLGIGLLAEGVGLDVAMWAMLLGPVALLVGLPRRAEAAR